MTCDACITAPSPGRSGAPLRSRRASAPTRPRPPRARSGRSRPRARDCGSSCGGSPLPAARRRIPPASPCRCRRAWEPWELPLAAHLHDPVLRARDGALHEQEVLLGVDLEHGQPELRNALATHAAGHLDALPDARRRRRRADRARLADVVRAVRPGAGAEVVALDRALEALADPDPGDLDLVARLEDLDRDGLTLDGSVDATAELDE